MAGPAEAAVWRRWEARVRAVGDHRTRQAEGVCFVEGIRAVRSAEEVGIPFEAVLYCPARLRSVAALAVVERLRVAAVPCIAMPAARFARLSGMDNPVGLAALVRWGPLSLDTLRLPPDALLLIAEDIGDPGNLGTLIRTADGAGAAAVVVAGGGTDPAHRHSLRASLGTAFRLPVAVVADASEAVAWAGRAGLTTVATSAQTGRLLWAAELRPPLALVVGSEERGLRPETAAACAVCVRIPMLGTATSLNVAVAAGILLYEGRRSHRWGCTL